MIDLYPHQDLLAALNRNIPLEEKLICCHEAVKRHFPFVARIAVALYDPKSSVLKTYLHSSGDDAPLDHYQALLDDAPSLQELLGQEQPRVVNHMVTFEKGEHEHTRRIGRAGYAASYTMPMFNNGTFFGFIFFNSVEQDCFKPDVLSELDIIGHMISLLIINELVSIQTLNAAVRTTGHITHVRDPETGSHLDRMSRYSRLIALRLADTYDLNDQYIEQIFMYSPLHDVGKIGIPDQILLKEGSLTDQEMHEMKSHAVKGREIIDDFLKNFGLESISQVAILRNIATFHHESINGSGYPDRIEGEAIPLEARIVAVADVFDALTSQRPYKEAWSNDTAFEMLLKLAGEKLDRDCVAALINSRDEVEEIQTLFQENPYG